MREIAVSSRLVQDTLRDALIGRETRYGNIRFPIDENVKISDIEAAACAASIVLNISSALRVFELRKVGHIFQMDFADLVHTGKVRFLLDATVGNGINFSSSHIGQINDWMLEFELRVKLHSGKPADMIAEQQAVALDLGLLI